MRIEEEIRQASFKSEAHKANLNVMFTGGWLNARTSQVLKPYKLSHQQYNVLRILRGSPGHAANLCDIQVKMLDRMSNATRLVEKLRLKGLLTRETCSENRRKVDIRLTDRGLQLLSSLDDTLIRLHAEGAKRLSEAEAAQLNALLDKMRG